MTKQQRNQHLVGQLLRCRARKGYDILPFVHDLQVSKSVDNNIIYARALCRIIVNPNGKPKIVAVQCDSLCPTGKGGCCCHVMTIIWKLDEMFRNKLLTNQCKDDRPCTSKPRKWGIPGKRTVMHEPIMASQFFKPRHQTDLPGHRLFMTHVQLKAEGLTLRRVKILKMLFSKQIRPFLSGK